MKRLLRRVLLASAASLLAATLTATARAPAAEAARRIPIHFATTAGKPFPSPLVRVRVDGEPASMVLDTGSTDIVLSGSIVQRLALATAGTAHGGVDAAGKKVSVVRLAAPRLAIEDWGRVSAAPVLTTPLPHVFDTLGIAGILSPQRLAPEDAAIVIAPASRQVLFTPIANAQRFLARSRGGTLLPVACRKVAGTCLYGIAARVDGHAAWLLVDTGAATTSLRSGSAAGRRLSPASAPSQNAHLAASGEMSTRVLAHARLRIGGMSVTLKVLLVPGSPSAHKGFDGSLGMNFLRRCTLVLDNAGGTLACR